VGVEPDRHLAAGIPVPEVFKVELALRDMLSAYALRSAARVRVTVSVPVGRYRLKGFGFADVTTVKPQIALTLRTAPQGQSETSGLMVMPV
jgi:hypothetical protein